MYIFFSCLHSSNGRYFIRGDIDPPRIYTDTYQLPLGDGRLAKQANERYIWKAIDSKDGIYLAVGGFFEIALSETR